MRLSIDTRHPCLIQGIIDTQICSLQCQIHRTCKASRTEAEHPSRRCGGVGLLGAQVMKQFSNDVVHVLVFGQHSPVQRSTLAIHKAQRRDR